MFLCFRPPVPCASKIEIQDFGASDKLIDDMEITTIHKNASATEELPRSCMSF